MTPPSPRQENPECIHCGLLLNTIIATKNLCITRTMGMNTIKQHRFYSPGISNNLLTLNEMRNKLVDSPSPTHEEGKWKDHELDHIWHDGIIPFIEKKISQYELLNIIEQQISSLLAAEERKVRERMESNIIGMIVKNSTGFDTINAQRLWHLDIDRFEKDLKALLSESYLEGKHKPK